MTAMILVCAVMGAGLAGGAAAHGIERWCTNAQRRKGVRRAAGVAAARAGLTSTLACEGLSARVIGLALRESTRRDTPRSGGLFMLRFLLSLGGSTWEDRVRLAGLEGLVTRIGAFRTCFVCAACLAALGAVVGAVLSPELSLLGTIVGCVAGWTALGRALSEEVRCRTEVAEYQLSQMIEVLVLGLTSGMSFDRSLSLYHERVSGVLARDLALAQGQWVHGLTERSEGLHNVARTFDSPLFSRFAENVTRSLRFGTSLAEGLSALAMEARGLRKAKLEERVAKVPVKMLLPVGTLILPAMLLLIMGPILLDLMAEV